ncbi:MAG: glutamate-ammonia-ligase adenylyltransferase [Pirellulaceae bacterium]|jgi:glutamate-ammonia-ligase adenylyltransferase
MDTATLNVFLDQPEEAKSWFRGMGLLDPHAAHQNLFQLVRVGVQLEQLATLCDPLEELLPASSDADMALANLSRFLAENVNPTGEIGQLIEHQQLEDLVQLFSASQYLADLLIADPTRLDRLRESGGQPVSRDELTAEICSAIAGTSDDTSATALLEEYKQRETLRIAYADIVAGASIDNTTIQISYLADALCEAALQASYKQLTEKRGVPQVRVPSGARFVAIGLGKLGGAELSYTSELELLFIYNGDGKTDGQRSLANRDFFDQLAKQMVKLLCGGNRPGASEFIQLTARPGLNSGEYVQEISQALRYYHVNGRTWERQAFVKARPVAGSLNLGQEFLEQMQPWIYRRYLNRADITGIKALKRRIDKRVQRNLSTEFREKDIHRGIRDLEHTIQFLQLLNGGDKAELRTSNTLYAIAKLENKDFITTEERATLEQNYAYLRDVQHRIEIINNPELNHSDVDEFRSDDELRRLALRLGYIESEQDSALEQFKREHTKRTTSNREILSHLLQSAFPDDEEADPETDLILDPDPASEVIEQILGPYHFNDVQTAYKNLQTLSKERIQFLSTRRCRHFLAKIVKRLLESIAATPDPDSTLANLTRVSDSLGGKGVLWELFSFNPPSMNLYVRLCASSDYLCGILTGHPGMIDELLDSLLVDKVPTRESLDAVLDELCRGVEDHEPILHSFKNSQHLRVGVRDILGKDTIQSTHGALSDVVESCLRQIIADEYEKLAKRFGTPMLADDGEEPTECQLGVLALGKLGGREPNYHSDLDLLFIYEADGNTKATDKKGKETSNQHFFGQLSQKVTKIVNQLGPFGRLYELDSRLRPTGKSGSFAVSLAELARHFAEEGTEPWELQALCNARLCIGENRIQDKCRATIAAILGNVQWTDKLANEMRQRRKELESTASNRNLKRGPGGTLDVEFAVAMLQLKHAGSESGVIVPGTCDALNALETHGILDSDDATALREGYSFLRSVESSLRLMNATARHDLPTDELDLSKLAFLLLYRSSDALIDQCTAATEDIRSRYSRLANCS